ncbi:hypothetical protein D3C72_2148530 [compost metagenome]
MRLQLLLRRLQVGRQLFQLGGQIVSGQFQLAELGIVTGFGNLLFDAVQLLLVVFQGGRRVRLAFGYRAVILCGNAGQRRQLQAKQQEQEKNNLTGL